jgi:hypothetical protein
MTAQRLAVFQPLSLKITQLMGGSSELRDDGGWCHFGNYLRMTESYLRMKKIPL